MVLAPTGVAALNVKGQTIHSFFNFYIDVTPESVRKKAVPKDKEIYKRLKTIIIDEASMVRADLLDCVEIFLQCYGPKPGQVFGGVQMVFVGDLYQIPPVVTSQERPLFKSRYETPYFFSAHCFKDFSFDLIELEKVYRQKDKKFVHLLNAIPNKSVSDKDMALLNSRFLPDFKPSKEQFFIHLTTTNKNAHQINEEYLENLKGKLYESQALIEGEFGKENFPTLECLQFKKGSQIMLLNNDSKKTLGQRQCGAH